MISYCAKEKKITPSIINSEEFVTTKSNRVMVKLTCSDSRFVKAKEGKSINQSIVYLYT